MNGKALIEAFYTAFARADAAGMIACYHQDIEFEDPAFGPLKGDDARNMWRMLVNPGLKLSFSNVKADEHSGSAHWEAQYTFGKTGNKVLNKIDAEFTFKDGKIIRHKDHFDFWKWSRQALGAPGLLLGWSPFLKNKVRKQALDRLRQFKP